MCIFKTHVLLLQPTILGGGKGAVSILKASMCGGSGTWCIQNALHEEEERELNTRLVTVLIVVSKTLQGRKC